MKGRAALLGVLLLAVFGIFVVYQSTAAIGNRVKFIPRNSLNLDGDDEDKQKSAGNQDADSAADDENPEDDTEVAVSHDRSNKPLIVNDDERERQQQEQQERDRALQEKQRKLKLQREEEERRREAEEREQELARQRKEAEEKDNKQVADRLLWNGLDPDVVHQKYPGIELYNSYKMRPFVDLSDPSAAGMSNKPADINDMTDSEAEERFYQLVVMHHVGCEPDKWMGNSGDGGWDVCISEPYKPQSGCLVYSFGINNDWSFDDTISDMYDCEVKAFDPSMNIGDHAHSDKVYFYNLGLFGKNFVNERNWKMRTFGTILHDLGHTDAIIDYLKIDIEFSEWSSLETMLREGSLRNVRQFGFEIHTPELNRKKTDRFEFEKMYNTLLELEKLGFRRWYHHFNHFGTYTSRRTGNTRTCCYEMVYINLNFLK